MVNYSSIRVHLLHDSVSTAFANCKEGTAAEKKNVLIKIFERK